MAQAKERTGAVKFKGNPMTLLGEDVLVGGEAPEFQVVDTDLQAGHPEGFRREKIRLITVVPSLDTGVCDTMTRTFNEKAATLPDRGGLHRQRRSPLFAQKRWCGNAGIEKVKTLSDYQDRSFGLNSRCSDQGTEASCTGGFCHRCRRGRSGIGKSSRRSPQEPNYDAALEAVQRPWSESPPFGTKAAAGSSGGCFCVGGLPEPGRPDLKICAGLAYKGGCLRYTGWVSVRFPRMGGGQGERQRRPAGAAAGALIRRGNIVYSRMHFFERNG